MNTNIEVTVTVKSLDFVHRYKENSYDPIRLSLDCPYLARIVESAKTGVNAVPESIIVKATMEYS